MRTYTVVLEPDAHHGGYSVTVPALPGVVVQGESIEQCLARATAAIRAHIAVLVEDGEAVPDEREPPQLFTVSVEL